MTATPYRWLNFRATSGYVTDSANQYFADKVSYPNTVGPFIHGWSTNSSVTAADRSNVVDPRLAGEHHTTSNVFEKIDLPEDKGVYRLKIGAGRLGTALSNVAISVTEGGTSFGTGNLLFTIGGSTGNSIPDGSFMTANGAVINTATWVATDGGDYVTFSSNADYILLKRASGLNMYISTVGLSNVPTLRTLTIPGGQVGVPYQLGEIIGTLTGSYANSSFLITGTHASLIAINSSTLEVTVNDEVPETLATLDFSIQETNVDCDDSPKTTNFNIPVFKVYQAPVEPASEVWPGDTWVGTPLGANVAPPTVARDTAKPTLHLRDFPHLVITEDTSITVGGYCSAGGIDYVECYCEGRILTEFKQRRVEYVAETGETKIKTGYTFNLKYANFPSDGSFDLYFRAVPKNPLLQARVIGPYRYHRKAAKFDGTMTVNPDVAATGNNFHTPATAVSAARTAGLVHPRILYQKTGDYDYSTPPANNYTGATEHWIWMECSNGVTATITNTTGNTRITIPANTSSQTLTNGLMFGKGMQIDISKINLIYFRDGYEFYQGWNGVRIFDPNGPYYLYDKDTKSAFTRPSSDYNENQLWISDTRFEGLNSGPRSVKMLRNSSFANGAGDVLVGSPNVYGLQYDQYDPTPLRTEIPSMTAVYNGVGSGFIYKTGSNGNSGSTIVVQSNGTNTVFACSTYPNVSDIVAQINGVSGWTANTLNDTQTSKVLTQSGSVGEVGPIDCTAQVQTLITMFDVHCDGIQLSNGGQSENILLENIRGTNCNEVQHLFMSNTNDGQHDLSVVNFLGHNEPAASVSQLVNSFKTHVFMQNCSFPDQRFMLRANTTGGSLDRYCDFSNNLFLDFDDSQLGTYGDSTGDNNISIDGEDPPFVTNTIIPATKEGLFKNYANLDFTPVKSGEAYQYRTYSKVPFDLYGNQRLRKSSIGAYEIAFTSVPAGSVTLTEEQAKTVVLQTYQDGVQTVANTITMTWKDGAGNTGNNVGVIVNTTIYN